MKVLAEFEDDNVWIDRAFFAGRTEGLFSTEIAARSVSQNLSPEACAAICSEILGTQVLSLRA
jgi:hypothetical protein